MKNILLIVFVFCILVANSQNPLFFHTRFGTTGNDVGAGIIQSGNGDFYYAIGETDINGSSQKDVLLTKNDKLGLVIWQKTFGGINSDIGKALVQLPDSGLMFVGYTSSFGNGGYDAYIVRLDKNGNMIWQKTFGGQDWDFGYSISKTLDGNLIICGSTYSYGAGNKDAFILKIDYDGNFIWHKIYGGVDEDDLKKIIQTADGGYIAVGTTKSYGDTLGDIWVTKFDLLGDSMWFKTEGGIKMEVGNSIVEDVNSEYLIVGGSESFSVGKEDAYIFKLDNSGTFVWRQNYGQPGYDEECNDVVNSISSYGNIVITYGTREQSLYGYDVKTLLLNSVGYYVRGGSFGSINNETMYSLFNTLDKGYVACGYTESYNAVNKDFFIIKYDSEMTIGPLIVSLKKNAQNRSLKIYPTLISENNFYVDMPESRSKPFSIEVFDLYGNIVKYVIIEEETFNRYKIYLSEGIKGMIFVNLNKGEHIQKCVVN